MEIRSEVSAPALMRPRSIWGIMEVVFPYCFLIRAGGGYGRMIGQFAEPLLASSVCSVKLRPSIYVERAWATAGSARTRLGN